ncbi:hypothetical protein AB6A40_009772 [Gnathostoma spinigerum]|uniref:Uncharacterized protein n=1 Tax=Gnathostoma spinigerum TaxID=75299 RepID=A0ABD6ESX8_9BILA
MNAMSVDFSRSRMISPVQSPPQLPSSTTPDTNNTSVDLSLMFSSLYPQVPSNFFGASGLPIFSDSAFLALTQHLRDVQKYPFTSQLFTSATTTSTSALSPRKSVLEIPTPVRPVRTASAVSKSDSTCSSPQRKPAAPIPPENKVR